MFSAVMKKNLILLDKISHLPWFKQHFVVSDDQMIFSEDISYLLLRDGFMMKDIE